MGGGDSSFVWISSPDELGAAEQLIESPVSSVDKGSNLELENGYESSLGVAYHYDLQKSHHTSDDDDESLIPQLENGSVMNRDFGQSFGEISETLMFMTAGSRKSKMYKDVLKSYENVRCRTERLDEAKRIVLSYTPGSWVEKAVGMDSDDYDVPKITSLLLIGPKASGKSSLVNKISQVLEDDVFTSARAQVSNSQLSEDGTYFIHQYMIPRRSGSFCLFDTRGLSDDTCENLKFVKHWMRKGIHHGELVNRKSDSTGLKSQLKSKKHGVGSSSLRRVIHFVVFVVDGLSVMEAMDGGNDLKEYYRNMATIFNNPLLSFKDDKPVLVVTHGDLLSLPDRVRIRVYLGELFRIPPTSQIFDIPESDDSATALTTLDMLIYCLERADRNLPVKKQHPDKKLPVKSKLAGKKVPVDNEFGDTRSIPLTALYLLSTFLIVLTLWVCYRPCPTNTCHASWDYGLQDSYTPTQTNTSTQTSHTHAQANQATDYGTQASGPIAATNESHSNCTRASHPHAPTKQSKEHDPQDSRNSDALTNESQENEAQDNFLHIPAHASLRDDVQANQPTDKARNNVDQARLSYASRRNDVKACHSRTPTHKSEAHGVKDGRKFQAPTVKARKEIKVEWHKIRHIWSE